MTLTTSRQCRRLLNVGWPVMICRSRQLAGDNRPPQPCARVGTVGMRRQEIWLVLVAYSIVGAAFGHVVAHGARLEYAPEIVVLIVALLGLGMSALGFVALLKR